MRVVDRTWQDSINNFDPEKIEEATGDEAF